jgi:hypothetical protein
MARILNHKGNSSGIRPLPQIHRERNPQDSENQQNNSYSGAEKNQYKHCFKKGHYKRNCPDFMKSLLKRGDEFITFIDESLYLSYAKST